MSTTKQPGPAIYILVALVMIVAGLAFRSSENASGFGTLLMIIGVILGIVGAVRLAISQERKP